MGKSRPHARLLASAAPCNRLPCEGSKPRIVSTPRTVGAYPDGSKRGLMDYDILVIDDEPSLRKLFASILNRAGYRVSTAESGFEGLKLLERNTYKTIMLDLKMPKMNGAETLREIRKIDKNVPVYIVTAFHREYFEALKTLRSDGIEFQILNKPIGKESLLQILDLAIPKNDPEKKPAIKLRLYIVGRSPKTQVQINDFHKAIRCGPYNEYSLEVIDVIDSPFLADQDHVLATPTLIKLSPPPVQRVIGNLCMGDMILQRLGLKKAARRCP